MNADDPAASTARPGRGDDAFDRVWADARELFRTGRGAQPGSPLVPLSCLAQAMERALGLAPYACAFRLITGARAGRFPTVKVGRRTLVTRETAAGIWRTRDAFVQPRRGEANPDFEARVAGFLKAPGGPGRWTGTAEELAMALGLPRTHPRVVARWLRGSWPGLLKAGVGLRYVPRSRDRVWVATLVVLGAERRPLLDGEKLGRVTFCRVRRQEVDWGTCLDGYVLAEACRDRSSPCFACRHGQRIRKQVSELPANERPGWRR